MNKAKRNSAIHESLQALQALLGDQPLSLGYGDYVIFNGTTQGYPARSLFSHHVGKECIITGISDDGVRYGINGCAWVPRESLRFVRRADIDSLTKYLVEADEEDEDLEDEDL